MRIKGIWCRFAPNTNRLLSRQEKKSRKALISRVGWHERNLREELPDIADYNTVVEVERMLERLEAACRGLKQGEPMAEAQLLDHKALALLRRIRGSRT